MKAFKHLFFGEAIHGAQPNRVKLNSVYKWILFSVGHWSKRYIGQSFP